MATDYSMLGTFATGGAAQLNGDLVNKLRDAEQKSALFSIDRQLGKITGYDADTKEALDFIGESDTLMVIKAQTMDLMSKISQFDLGNSGTKAFDAVAASTTGTAAVFDAVDVSGLQPGTTNINVSQLAQRDVYQSISFNATAKDSQLTADVEQGGMSDEQYRDYIAAAGLNITVGDKSYSFSIVQNPSAGTIAELGAKTIEELAAEINEKDELIASIEQVGEDQFRLVVKSAESGIANQVNISQTNFNLGFTNGEFSSQKVDDTAALIGDGEIEINGVTFSTNGKTYEALATEINNYDANIDGDSDPLTNPSDTFNASIVAGQIVISRDDGADLTITQTGVDLGFYNSEAHHVQKAQNLKANIDGIDYNTSLNTITIQGNLSMTAVELGSATIDIQRDTSAVMNGLQSVIDSYNELSELISAESGNPDSSLSDISSIRDILSGVKDQLFKSYGENGDLNLFNFGAEIDISGKLSLDSAKFGKALNDNYSQIKELFLGNTTDVDTASSDATKFMGLGTVLQDYLDDLDSNNGLLSRYETSMAQRKERLETEREETIKSLDSKYAALANQFTQYASVIAQFESAFSGLSLMINQSVARN